VGSVRGCFVFNVSNARAVAGRAVFACAAVGAALAFTAPAQAADVVVNSVKLFSEGVYGQSDARPFDFMSPFVIDADSGADHLSLLAFCIQLDVDMPYNPGADGFTPIGLTYHDAPLNSSDDELVGKLVNYGEGLFDADPDAAGLDIELGAIQGAIWRLTGHPDAAFLTAMYDDPGTPENEADAFNQKITDYAAGLGLGGASSHIRSIYSGLDQAGAPLAQGLAFAGQAPTSDVPEPAAWALMILGFGGAGGALRLARRRAATA